eukprot:gene8888-9066_t
MRRVALLECEDAEKWEGYTELVCKGELPSPEEAAAFDAVIVGGSHYSAYEQHEWIQKLLEFLPVVAAQQQTRIYGCCFGCQILARALGGQKIWRTLKDRGVLTKHQAEDSRRVLEAADSNTGLFLQLKQLEMTVGKLDKQSRDLEARVAKLQSVKDSKGAGAGSSAYSYLSFSRASSSMAAAAAAGAGQCLGGANLPKE